MNYQMTKPCKACPFLKGSGFPFARLKQFASGEFPCHKASNLVEAEDGHDVYVEKGGDKTPHCAGALIFNEKRNQPHQMARICERIGMYDASKLDMDAPVGSRASDFKHTTQGKAA